MTETKLSYENDGYHEYLSEQINILSMTCKSINSFFFLSLKEFINFIIFKSIIHVHKNQP